MLFILFLIVTSVHSIPLTSPIWVTSDPAPGQSPGPPMYQDTSWCTTTTNNTIINNNYFNNNNESNFLNINISHLVFKSDELIAGINYQVEVRLPSLSGDSWLAITSDVIGSGFKSTTAWHSTWILCSGQGLAMLVPANTSSISIAWSLLSIPDALNVTIRAELYSKAEPTQLIARTTLRLPLIAGCVLHVHSTQENITWSTLEAASAIYPECDVYLARPADPQQGLLLTMTRLNIAGNPENCEDGYLLLDSIIKLCGKLEEQPRTELYWSEIQNDLPIRIHFPTHHPLPMYYSFNIRTVAPCYNLTLHQPNATFSTEITSDLICTLTIHVAYGYRVALSVQLRSLRNKIEDVVISDNIWDEAPSEEYTEEGCGGVLIHVSGEGGEYWTQCASGPGHVIRALSQGNRLVISVSVFQDLTPADTALHIRYFSVPRPELTDDCPGYGWISVSETSCALPVTERAATWSQANKECARHGAHLVSVTSHELQVALDQLIRRSPGYNDDVAYWLGATDRIREGDFRWSDGHPLTYTNWFPGWSQHAYYNRQPSDDGLSEQDCIEMRRTFLAPAPIPGMLGGEAQTALIKETSSLMWNDRDCGALNFYICQTLKTGAKRNTAITEKSTCNRNLTLSREIGHSPAAVVTSPGFPQPYPDNARCLTRVRAPPGYHVVIEFEELVLEKEPMCSYDYLEISEPDAEETARRLCHDWSGKLKLLRHVSKGSELQLLFSSDYSHRFGGFKARVFMESDELECADSRETSFNGSCFLLVGFPEVTWNTARQVCRGMRSDLASIHSIEEQRFLVSTIRKSEQYSANAIYWLGGQIQSDGHFGWIDLSVPSFLGWPVRASRSYRDETRCLALGWQPSPLPNLPSGLYWQTQRCSLVGGYVCQRRVQETNISLHKNQTMEGISGTITSPNFPEAYPANANYWIHVIGPPNSRLIFNFSRVDLEPQAECLYDFVELWDDEATEPSSVLCGQRFIENELPQFVSLSNIVLLHFHSDYAGSGSGFSVTWRSVLLLGCPEQTLTAREGVLFSPNYPHFLLSGLDCSTTILAPAGRRVWLQFEETDLDPEWASLEVQLGGESPPLLPLQLYNLISDGVFLSENESLRVTLRTAPGRRLIGRGFRANYYTVSHVDETRVINLEESDNMTSQLLLSLNWPAPAPKPGSITGYTQRLVAPLGYVISLTLRGVHVFSTPPSLPSLCLEVRDNYAEINGSASWLLCRDKREESPTPVVLNSYLNSLSITQVGGDVLNASVTLLTDPGFKQKLMTKELTLESCTPNPCLHGGHCLPSSGGRPASCQCPKTSHYTGTFCALTWCEVSPCEYGVCSMPSTGGFLCTCQPGYRGELCDERYRPCLENPCEGRGECHEKGDGFTCRCHAWWEGPRCERRMMRIPFKPLSERMLHEPFWLGLITVMVVLLCIGLVWCAKRHFPEKLEKLLADEADRSKHISYSLSTSTSRDPCTGSPVGVPRHSLLGRLGLRKPSLLSLSPASPKDGSAPRTFSLDDLLRRTPSPRKKRTNSTPTRKPIDKKHILQQLVTPSGSGTSTAGTSTSNRKVSLGELIQLSDKSRRANSVDGPVPSEAETSLDLDPKLEKKVTFARLLDKMSAEMSSGGSNSNSPPQQLRNGNGSHQVCNSGSEDVTFSGSDPVLPVTSRRLLGRTNNRLARMSSADSILAMFRTTFAAKASSTPSSPADASECDSSAVPTPASSSAPDSPLSMHHTTIEVPVLSSGGGSSSSLLHPPTILLEIPSIEYGKCLSPIKEVPTPCPSPAPTPLMLPKRRASQERLEDDEALRIEVLHPAPGPQPSLTSSVAPSVTSPQLSPDELSSPTRLKARPPSTLQIPAICLPDEEKTSPKGSNDIIIPILTVQTPSPPAGSPPPNKKIIKRGLLLRDSDKSGSLDYPCAPPMITITAMSEIESDVDTTKPTTTSGMTYLSPFSMCARADHRTTSESNLSSSGYSSMASPGPSRCGSSNPLCTSEPEEILTPSVPSSSPPIPPPRKPSLLIRTPAIQENNQVDSNDEGFGTDHLEDTNGKLQLPSIIVQPVNIGNNNNVAVLSPVSSRSESPLSDRTYGSGLDRFSPLFYNNHNKPELPYTDSDGLYDCPSSEVQTTTPRKQVIGNRKKERRRSNAATATATSRGALGGLLEVPTHQIYRSARKPSPKRRAARIAPPSSSSSSESLSSFRGSRGNRGGQDVKKSASQGQPEVTSPSTTPPEAGEGPESQEGAGSIQTGSETTRLYPPPCGLTRGARKVSRMKTIGHQIRFLRRLELSLRRREQQSPSDSLDTDLSSPLSSPTLPVSTPNLFRLKARALSRRQLPARLMPRCELATLLLATPPCSNHHDIHDAD